MWFNLIWLYVHYKFVFILSFYTTTRQLLGLGSYKKRNMTSYDSNIILFSCLKNILWNLFITIYMLLSSEISNLKKEVDKAKFIYLIWILQGKALNVYSDIWLDVCHIYYSLFSNILYWISSAQFRNSLNFIKKK